MKKLLVMVALACLTVSGLAYADLSDYASSHVYVNVVPNISISPAAATVGLGTIQTGPFGTGISFRVDANTEQVKFMAGVSRLYKGDCPTCQLVAPIEICERGGVEMVIEQGMPIGGHSSKAVYDGSFLDIQGGFIGRQTEWVTFESAQNNHFSQSITVTPAWVQTDDEKPVGEYSGVVALWAMVVPVQTIGS